MMVTGDLTNLFQVNFDLNRFIDRCISNPGVCVVLFVCGVHLVLLKNKMYMYMYVLSYVFFYAYAHMLFIFLFKYFSELTFPRKRGFAGGVNAERVTQGQHGELNPGKIFAN